MSQWHLKEYDNDKWVVFISHAAADTYVAKQIASDVSSCGAYPFLDKINIAIGEDFEESILSGLDYAKELLVLLTPSSLKRLYVWAEIGAAWGKRIMIVGILYGVTAIELQSDAGIPIIIKRRNLIDINDLDKYLEQLRERVASAAGKSKEEKNDDEL